MNAESGPFHRLTQQMLRRTPKDLSGEGKHALEQLRTMVNDIQRIKAELHPLPDSPDAARELIKALKERFPELKSA